MLVVNSTTIVLAWLKEEINTVSLLIRTLVNDYIAWLIKGNDYIYIEQSFDRIICIRYILWPSPLP